MRSHPAQHGEGFDAALDLPPQQPGGPIPHNMARALMPRQP